MSFIPVIRGILRHLEILDPYPSEGNKFFGPFGGSLGGGRNLEIPPISEFGFDGFALQENKSMIPRRPPTTHPYDNPLEAAGC